MKRQSIVAIRLVAALLVGAVAVAAGGALGRLPASAESRSVAAPADRSQRGEVVSVSPLRSLRTPADVRSSLSAAGFDQAAVRYGVDAYQVVYRTVDVDGRPTIASGLVALPRGGANRLRVVSYAHGTEFNRLDVPSFWRDGWAAAPAVSYASAGYAAVAPDYLGLGLGPGVHPYLDLPSEATASLDLLRAARTVAADHDRKLEPAVFVTGFSQGATAANALAEDLQRGRDDFFRLGALAPVAGPYALRSVEIPALLDGRVPAPWNVGYTAYVLTAWNRIHDLYRDPADVFEVAGVEELFDGLHTPDDLGGTLPGTLDGLLTDEGLDLVRNPSGPMARALAEHDASCTGFAAGTPVRLLVAPADEQVPRANSDVCLGALRASRADAAIVELPGQVYNGSVHLGSNVDGTARALAWFQQLRG